MTIGLSPKVRNPFLILVAVGLVLLAVGLATGDNETKAAGLAAIASALAVVGPVGYASDPGDVLVDAGPASDSLLDNVDGEPVSGPTPAS